MLTLTYFKVSSYGETVVSHPMWCLSTTWRKSWTSSTRTRTFWNVLEARGSWFLWGAASFPQVTVADKEPMQISQVFKEVKPFLELCHVTSDCIFLTNRSNISFVQNFKCLWKQKAFLGTPLSQNCNLKSYPDASRLRMLFIAAAPTATVLKQVHPATKTSYTCGLTQEFPLLFKVDSSLWQPISKEDFVRLTSDADCGSCTPKFSSPFLLL